jgi:hypothetical protein
MSEQSVIPQFIPQFLDPSILEQLIYPDMSRSWYWSDCWVPSFYVDLAKAGFITICTDHPDAGYLLLPQIHSECAVLDWCDRHMSRSLRSLLHSGIAGKEGLSLRITAHPSRVTECLSAAWGEQSWLHPPYLQLIELLSGPLASDARNAAGFTLVGVELLASGCERPVAGELGYVIGKTYTSLSGFMHPDRKRWSDMGKIQLHALAIVLERAGFAFWNLGQCQMQYKRDLGARILSRPDFLSKWQPAASADPGDILIHLLECEIPCTDLFG